MSGLSLRPAARGTRRRLGAVLALVYLWAFVALGLTHSHNPASAPSCCTDETRVTATAALPTVTSAAAPSDNAPCRVCAAAHTATVALLQPPVAVTTPGLARLLCGLSTPVAPTRSFSSSQPRAPPQA